MSSVARTFHAKMLLARMGFPPFGNCQKQHMSCDPPSRHAGCVLGTGYRLRARAEEATCASHPAAGPLAGAFKGRRGAHMGAAAPLVRSRSPPRSHLRAPRLGCRPSREWGSGGGSIVTGVPGTMDQGTRNDVFDAFLHCGNENVPAFLSRNDVPGRWNAVSFPFRGD